MASADPARVVPEIVRLGLSAAPREACGYVFGSHAVVGVRNVASDPTHAFLMHPGEQRAALDRPDAPTAIWHTHPVAGPPTASDLDVGACNAHGLPWLIVTIPQGECLFLMPQPEQIPALRGRPYLHGVYDCYTLCRDYYRLERGITLPEPPDYGPHWYRHGDLLGEQVARMGFTRVPFREAVPGDLLVLATRGPSRGGTHLAIFLGGNRLLHQDTGASGERLFDPADTPTVLRYLGAEP